VANTMGVADADAEAEAVELDDVGEIDAATVLVTLKTVGNMDVMGTCVFLDWVKVVEVTVLVVSDRDTVVDTVDDCPETHSKKEQPRMNNARSAARLIMVKTYVPQSTERDPSWR